MQETGNTEDVPACFSFGIVLFINAAIWRKMTMEFFNQAITVLQTLVVAIGAGLGVWGVVNLMEGYGNDNPGAKSQGMKQITARDPEHDYRFMNLDFVKRHGMEVSRADYELVYTAPLTEKDTLEAIYERFNIQRPADFTGHSLSVSDVVVLNDGKSIKACYVDSIGFAELPDFFKERKMDLQKETILDEQLQEIEIFDKPGLFSNGRLRDEDVPEGLYRYDLRGSDYDPGQPILVEKTVIVNHAASILMAEELDLGADGRLELGEEGLNFTGGLLTVREFMKEQEEKNNGLLHGDSYNITVEGHIGTWYAIDETEVNGEKGA